jgi:hypothetical protein
MRALSKDENHFLKSTAEKGLALLNIAKDSSL